MNKNKFSRGISLKKIHVTDKFLGQKMELVRKEVIPYQWEALNDRVEGAEPSFCMRNFRLAAELGERRRSQGQQSLPVFSVTDFNPLPESVDKMEDRFYGFVFQDTDFSKWIEAVGYSLAQHPDPELEKVADEAIDVVCRAQYEDGYLDTYYIINDPSKRFTNLMDHHELYCFGHLTEGAIAYYEATGKDKLLRAVMRFADYIDSVFGPGEGKCKGYPGHEIAEMALGRLYEVTGEERYLRLEQFFVEQRGQKPYYFRQEQNRDWGENGRNSWELPGEKDYYHQAHLPVRQQKEAVGHAVRAVYLYTGMAQVAKYTEDEELKKACETLWKDIENRKMYITGGIGATPAGEAFSYKYYLPNDKMYNETCASIGLVFFARRMLEMEPKSCYADVMERAVYNGIPSGMALDGKSFFYVNPMEAEPEGCKEDPQRKHVALPRQKWFGCACCPPNLARLFSSIAQYAYSENEDTLWMHLYCGGELQKDVGESSVKISVKSAYPWEDQVKISFAMEKETKFTYAVRLPGWCREPSVAVNGEPMPVEKAVEGYLYLSRQWRDGDEILLHFPMEPVFYQADTRVRADVGKAALMRGPVVYCVEEADNGPQLELLEADVARIPRAEWRKEKLGGIVQLRGRGRRIRPREGGQLYHPLMDYEYEETEITWIPYYSWCNRGAGEMKTYLGWYRSEL